MRKIIMGWELNKVKNMRAVKGMGGGVVKWRAEDFRGRRKRRKKRKQKKSGWQ